MTKFRMVLALSLALLSSPVFADTLPINFRPFKSAGGDGYDLVDASLKSCEKLQTIEIQEALKDRDFQARIAREKITGFDVLLRDSRSHTGPKYHYLATSIVDPMNGVMILNTMYENHDCHTIKSAQIKATHRTMWTQPEQEPEPQDITYTRSFEKSYSMPALDAVIADVPGSALGAD